MCLTSSTGRAGPTLFMLHWLPNIVQAQHECALLQPGGLVTHHTASNTERDHMETSAVAVPWQQQLYCPLWHRSGTSKQATEAVKAAVWG